MRIKKKIKLIRTQLNEIEAFYINELVRKL